MFRIVRMTQEKEPAISHTEASNAQEITNNDNEWFIRGIDIIPPNSHRTTPRQLPSEIGLDDKTNELSQVDAVLTFQNNDNWLD